MRKEVFILKYRNGQFVKLDDSSGPMSTGGYPYPVDSIEQATTWDTAEEASKYLEHFQDLLLHPLTIRYELSPRIPKVDFWTGCDHRCKTTPLSTAANAKHYLDCPVWGFTA